MPNLEDLKKIFEKKPLTDKESAEPIPKRNLPHSYMEWYKLIHESNYTDPASLAYIVEKCSDGAALHSMLGHQALYQNKSARIQVYAAIVSNKNASESTLKEILYNSNEKLRDADLKAIAEKASSVLGLGQVLNKVQDIEDKSAATDIITAVKNNKHYADFPAQTQKDIEKLLQTKQSTSRYKMQ